MYHGHRTMARLSSSLFHTQEPFFGTLILYADYYYAQNKIQDSNHDFKYGISRIWFNFSCSATFPYGSNMHHHSLLNVHSPDMRACSEQSFLHFRKCFLDGAFISGGKSEWIRVGTLCNPILTISAAVDGLKCA